MTPPHTPKKKPRGYRKTGRIEYSNPTKSSLLTAVKRRGKKKQKQAIHETGIQLSTAKRWLREER